MHQIIEPSDSIHQFSSYPPVGPLLPLSIIHSNSDLDCQTSFLSPHSAVRSNQNSRSTIEPFVRKKCSHITSVTSQGTQTDGTSKHTSCSFAGRFEVRNSNLLHPTYMNRRIKYAFNFRQVSLSSMDSSNHSSRSNR